LRREDENLASVVYNQNSTDGDKIWMCAKVAKGKTTTTIVHIYPELAKNLSPVLLNS
jgi:hypothetical protein